MHSFLELQFLVDDLVDFVKLSMFINTSLTYVYYLLKWIGNQNMKNTPHFVRYRLYLLFFNSYG